MPITGCAPRALASCTCNWPVTPSPRTTADSPGKMLIRRCECKQVVSTWINGAVRSSIASGRAKHVGRRRGHIFGKAAVDVAPQQHAVGAQVRLADSAVETLAADKVRGSTIDPVSRPERALRRFDYFPDHFVAHDPRIPDRNRTV